MDPGSIFSVITCMNEHIKSVWKENIDSLDSDLVGTGRLGNLAILG